jgi:hypothetical protein
MDLLLKALDGRVRQRGSKWVARCPVHDDKDYAMTIEQASDGSVIAHCFACGANGLDLYRHLNLPLDELFGGREGKQVVPQRIHDEYQEDRFFRAVYEASEARGEYIKLADKRRYRLAVARMKGIKDKWGDQV